MRSRPIVAPGRSQPRKGDHAPVREVHLGSQAPAGVVAPLEEQALPGSTQPHELRAPPDRERALLPGFAHHQQAPGSAAPERHQHPAFRRRRQCDPMRPPERPHPEDLPLPAIIDRPPAHRFGIRGEDVSAPVRGQRGTGEEPAFWPWGPIGGRGEAGR